MKKSVEIALNLIFWALSYWIITQLLKFDIQEVEIRVENGREIVEERISDLSRWFYYGIALKAVLFYFIVFFIVPKFISPLQFVKFAFFLLAGVAVAILLELFPVFEFTNGVSHAYVNASFTTMGFYVSVALVYGIVRNQLGVEKKKQQLSSEKLQAELKLLKSQINPHFLFNALNNLLAVSEKSGSSEISAGITELSDLLRFLIYDTQTDVIPVQKEVDFIDSYISLLSMRYAKDDDITVDFGISGVDSNHLIAPSLLIPFVENAFKHGVNLRDSSFVNIDLSINENVLHFDVKNSLHFYEKTELDKRYSGVGLENVKKRLLLSYPDEHKLNIEHKDDSFSVQLEIDLSRD